jgi:hypothetical protein
VTDILVINKSTLVTDHDVRAMTRAVSYQVHHHAAPALGLKPLTVDYIEDESEAKAGDWVLGVLDNADQEGVLGWHTSENDVIYGRVFVQPSLNSGSTALTGPYAVSSVLSHEALETLGDPHVNQWAEVAPGLMVAYELCDPVESFTYVYHDKHMGLDVALSDFVTPEWFDPQRSPGERFDYLGLAPAPATLTPGGYWVQATIASVIPTGADVVEHADRGVTYVFGPAYPDWKKPLKQQGAGRTARRDKETT